MCEAIPVQREAFIEGLANVVPDDGTRSFLRRHDRDFVTLLRFPRHPYRLKYLQLECVALKMAATCELISIASNFV